MFRLILVILSFCFVESVFKSFLSKSYSIHKTNSVFEPLKLSLINFHQVDELTCTSKLFSTSVDNVAQDLSKFTNVVADGSVSKELMISGQGKAVETGDILAIEYTATVVGSNKPFAKGEQEKFVYKDGSMIKGWDVGVGSMKIGEKARLRIASKAAYGSKGIENIIPADADIEVTIRILAWLGNQLNPESLFSKDLDIDPFVASSPEAIQTEFDNRQASIADKYRGNIFQIYWNRIKNISFGFGGSNFFASQSGERAPLWLNPNITFPTMISITLAAFIIVLATGSVKEKGTVRIFDSAPNQGNIKVDS